MAEETGFHLNGHDPEGEETEAGLQIARKTLESLAPQGGGGLVSSLTKGDMTLLKQMLHVSSDTSDDFIKITLICDFMDDEEANRELNAFYEAERLGMCTKYNIAHALSRAAINRKGAHQNSRVASLLDALSHQKYTSNQPRSSDSGNRNPKSPIA
jgi:hypothetical protein